MKFEKSFNVRCGAVTKLPKSEKGWEVVANL
jgi:hypothetical protein